MPQKVIVSMNAQYFIAYKVYKKVWRMIGTTLKSLVYVSMSITRK